MRHRRLLMPLATLAIVGAAVATPPKPGIQEGTGTAAEQGGKSDQTGPDQVRVRNAMALRGGVAEDVWLEALHRITRVPTERRETITRDVRAYIVAADAWRQDQAPQLKSLTSQLLALREAGEPVPRQLSSDIRRIRLAMPRLSDLQARIWDMLSSPEQGRLVDEVTELKRAGLPKDVVDGRRAPGAPARVTGSSEGEAGEGEAATDQADAAPLLWSFTDDPEAGKPLPELKPESKAAPTDGAG